MVNQYYTPALLNFVDLYIPIPFDLLMQIGKEMNARRDKAQALLNEKIRSWREFYSPSTKDMQAWDNFTINNPAVREVMDAAANDPDYFKTAKGLAAVANLDNSIDYGALRMLQANAKRLEEYSKNAAELRAKGAATWDDLDVSTYNTLSYTDNQGNFVLGSGMLNNTSPMLRKEVYEVVSPLFDDLNESYIGKTPDGDYLVSGVSLNRIENLLRTHYNELMKHPQIIARVDNYRRSLEAQGVPGPQARERALSQVRDEIATAAEKFSWTKRTADPITLKLTSSSGRGGRGGGSSPQADVPMLLTNSIAVTGMRATERMRNSMFYMSKPELAESLSAAQTALDKANADYVRASKSGDATLVQQATTAKKAAEDALNKINETVTDEYELYKLTPLPEQLRDTYLVGYDYGDLLDGANRMIKDFSGNVLTGMGSMQQFINGIGGVEKSDKELLATDTSDLDLIMTYASRLTGKDLSQTTLANNNLIQIGLRENKFQGVVIRSVNRTFSPEGKDNRAELTILIPEKELFKYGGLPDIIAALQTAQARPVQRYGETTKTQNQSSSTRYKISDGDLSDRKAEAVTESSNSSSSLKQGEKYWAIPVIARLPNTGGGVNAELFNQLSLKANMTSDQAGDLYTTNLMYNTVPLSR